MDFNKTKNALFTVSNVLIALFVLALLLSPFRPELVVFRLKIIGLFLVNLSFILSVYLLGLFYRFNYSDKETGLEKYLSRLPGIAKDWAHGGTETLDKYAFDLLENDIDNADWGDNRPVIEKIEEILRQSEGANIFLEGEEDGLREIIFSLIQEIKCGSIAPEIERRRPVFLEAPFLIRNFNESAGLKREIERILEEAERAANVTLIINGLSDDAFYSLRPFLNSPFIQTIITIPSGHSCEYLNDLDKGYSYLKLK